jgi:DMSO/TMAO reductase YedYZ heme-binding membrane subunit
VGLGLVLSHPRNTAAWRTTRQVVPWHELITVFVWAFLILHIVLMAIDPYAKVGWLGALVPGLSEYRTPAIAIGTVAVYAMLITAITAKWTKLLPDGWWLKIHRLSALTFLATWVHSVLAGTDGGALMPVYLATGLPILLGVAHRWWTVKSRPRRVEEPATSALSLIRPQPATVTVEES